MKEIRTRLSRFGDALLSCRGGGRVPTGDQHFCARPERPEEMKALHQGGKNKLRPKTKMGRAILITLLVCAFLSVPILHLRAGEKRIRYELTHRFAVEDPQFLRCIYDAVFAAEQVRVFGEDKGNSRLMTRAELKNRSVVGKTLNEIAATFRRQL